MKKLKEKQIQVKEKKIKKAKKDNKNSVKNASFSLFEVISVIVITAVVVSLCSGVVVFTNYSNINKKINYSKDSSFKELQETYNHIIGSYVDKIDEGALVNSAIKGMFDYLEDNNTDYLEEGETQDLQEKLNGKYTGIGIEVRSDDNGIILVKVFVDTPAHEAGLKAGDKILSINGQNLEGKDSTYLANILKKEKNQTYIIEYKREDKTSKVTVKTQEVQIPSVTSKIIDNIGYLKINAFAQNTYNQFNKELVTLESSNIKGLIIDVRSNTGGYLDSAYNIADLFIKKDKIIYQLRDKDGKKTAYKAKTEESREYQVVFLINGGSASASEILAASLKDNNNAKFVGTTSYGKGTVQNTQNLTGGSMIKYTTAYWLTPKGICINKIGLKPDTEVEFKIDKDIQLEAALKEFQ
ncbi:MAG: S41 family peptidase [Bacilli bacterium]